ALRAADTHPAEADHALNTAKDLHILVDERSKIRFEQPSLLHLFAAFAASDEEIMALAVQEEGWRQNPPTAPSPRLPAPTMTAPAYIDYRYDEVYQFAAQLRGTDIPDQLIDVDPVLAARVYLSIRADLDSDAREIAETLLQQLDRVRGHRERSAIIAALG